MSLQGSFGVPNTRQQLPSDRQYPLLYVLAVTVANGGFEQMEDIGAAVRESEVERYFDDWLSKPENKSRYTGRKRIKRVPFVGRL